MATVLTEGRKTETLQSPHTWALEFTVATGEVIFKGGMVELVNATGLLRVAGTSAAGSAKTIGKALADTRTAAGISGAAAAGSTLRVECGVHIYENSVANPVTVTSRGSKVYVENDKTISTLNSLPMAGVMVDINPEGHTGIAVLQTIAPLNV